jgi:membrane fusion protein (multidrug efflux system)
MTLKKSSDSGFRDGTRFETLSVVGSMPQSIRRVILFNFIGIWMVFGLSCSPSNEKENKVPPKKPVPVVVMEIKTQDFPLIIESAGRLAANREVTLAAEVGGVVEECLTNMGDKVKSGQVLVCISPVDYELGLKEAQANLRAVQARLDAATKTYKRSEALIPQKVISEELFEKNKMEYKAAQAALAQAKAMVEIAKERVRKTEIVAPFSGLVAERKVEHGQTVVAGVPVVTVVDLDYVRVKIHLTEADYIRVDKDDPVIVTFEAYPEKQYIGKIDRIGVKADERTNTFDVEILIENPDLVLKAGLTGRVRITSDIIPNAILIPQSAVLYKEKTREVFIVDSNNCAQPREIKLGRTKASQIQVLEGLAPGDRLIVTGGQYLNPGDQVSITAYEIAQIP